MRAVSVSRPRRFLRTHPAIQKVTRGLEAITRSGMFADGQVLFVRLVSSSRHPIFGGRWLLILGTANPSSPSHPVVFSAFRRVHDEEERCGAGAKIGRRGDPRATVSQASFLHSILSSSKATPALPLHTQARTALPLRTQARIRSSEVHSLRPLDVVPRLCAAHSVTVR